MLRTVDRLTTGLDGINRSPAGAGGVNGSPLVGDRARTAALLGFDGVIEHTRDAMWQSDGLTGLVADAASLATTLDRLAEDLEIYASAEFGWVVLGEGHTRSSVLMPQKRNPYALTMVRGAAGVLIGRATGMSALAKSPSARSDNLIFAYGEVPRALELATRTTRLMAGVVRDLTVDAERMRAALYGGFAQAADLAEHLMATVRLDYRSAYDLVGAAVRRAAAEGLAGSTSPARTSTRPRPRPGSPHRRSPSWTSRPRSTPRRSSGAGRPAGAPPRTSCAAWPRSARPRRTPSAPRSGHGATGSPRPRPPCWQKPGRLSPASGGRAPCPPRARAACRWRCSAGAGSGRSRW